MSNIQNYTTIPRNGLVGEWLLDGNANDTAGSNNGTASNVTWVDASKGYVKEAGSFNGSSSYVDTGYKFNATEVTISCWIKTSYTPTNNDGIISNYDLGTPGEHIGIRINTDGKLYGYADDNVNATWAVLSNSDINTGKWIYCTYIFKANDYIKLYINGVLETTQNTTTGIVDNFRSWFIGKDGEHDYYFDGQIGLARIYNRVLNESEIQSLYQEGQRRLGPTNLLPSPKTSVTDGLVSEWSLNGHANDLAGSNNGTPTNVTYDLVWGGEVGSFDGSSVIDTGANIDYKGSDDFSVSVYIKPENSSGIDNYIMGTDLSVGFYMRVDSIADNILFKIDDGVNDAFERGGQSILDGKYHNIIMVNNTVDSSLKGYIDGIEVINISNSGVGEMYDNLLIGRVTNYDSGGSTSHYFNGEIGLAKVYNKALSQSEISQLYNEGAKYIEGPKSSTANLQDGLVLSLDGDGNDQSGNGNNGTPANLTKITNGLHTGGSYNGSSSEIDGSLNISGFSEITVNFFGDINTSGDTDILFSILHSGSDDIRIFKGSDENIYYVLDDGTVDSIIGNAAGGMHMYTLTYNGTTLKAFEDGVEIGSIAGSFDFGTATGGFSIGNRVGGSLYGSGEIFNPKVWNRALSVKEIEQEYKLNYLN